MGCWIFRIPRRRHHTRSISYCTHRGSAKSYPRKKGGLSTHPSLLTQNQKIVKAEELGIWKAHALANLIEFTIEPIETKVFESKFTHEVKEQALHKGENRMHNKEQHGQADYDKRLGDMVKKYKEVVLFGLTDAKIELLNSLIKDHHFDNVKIEVKQTDKITENQQHAFFKDYFAKHVAPLTILNRFYHVEVV
jgi:hypothetical protein